MFKKITFCMAFLLGSLSCLKAEQLLGVNISYRNLGSYKFEVTYHIYSDKYVDGKLDTTVFKPLTFKVISGSAAVINYPKLIKKDSINVGCIYNSMFNPISIYIDTVDLNLSKYWTIKYSGVCRTYFTCQYPERYRGLKNIAASAYVTYAFINTCYSATNSSASIHNYPFSNICCNQPYFKNYNAFDTTNFDSLSYSLIQPFNDYNSKIAFSSGYSVDEQLDVYWPTGYDKSKGSDRTVNPPIGLYLDKQTGDLIFTPTSCNSDYSITTETIENIKIGGQYKEAGGFLNDFVLKVRECPDNNPPNVNGPYMFEVEAGKQICFTVTCSDKQFIPPPPHKPSPPDTVSLTWNRGIPGATFTIVDLKARFQNGKFCWTPGLTQYSETPYAFTVTARDNSCPVNASFLRSFTIKVIKPLNSISHSNPYNIIISPNPSLNGELTITSDNFKIKEVALFDISGKQLIEWEFEQTGEFSKDLNYLAPGVYFIKCKNGGEVYNFKWIRE